MNEGDFLEEPFEPGNPDHVGHYPGEPRYIGDKAVVERKNWYDGLTPRQAYSVKHRLPPELADNIDYEPGTDEDLSEWQEQGED